MRLRVGLTRSTSRWVGSVLDPPPGSDLILLRSTDIPQSLPQHDSGLSCVLVSLHLVGNSEYLLPTMWIVHLIL